LFTDDRFSTSEWAWGSKVAH